MSDQFTGATAKHPRQLGWVSSAALAMGGSNQSLFLITALFVGQGDILGQGSAAVPLLIVGLLLSWAAAPAWTELVLMWPNRVGGISAACAEAFRPYSPVLAAITGTCYWWGWVPTCGLTALLSASAIKQWYLPHLPVEAVACAIVLAFTAANLMGIRWVARLAIPLAAISASLAFLAALIPALAGTVDWHQSFDFKLTTPFEGWFGDVTSAMAGLYLIGFAAPAFEAAACHVGETVNPRVNVPRAMVASGIMAGIYFLVLPVIWLGALGPAPLGQDLAIALGPVFAPLLGSLGKAAAIWFIMVNMFHGTLQPLAGAARTLTQLSEDGLLPRFLSARSATTDCPWTATLVTAGFAIIFLLLGDPIWLIAAANFTYLISICMPNVAAWLLRRDMPNATRLYRAPRGTIGLGLVAACIWMVSAILGFEQFGLPTVLFGLMLAYSGAAFYAWRVIEDNVRAGRPAIGGSLHLKLTGAMLLVLFLDSAGYLMAIKSLPTAYAPLLTGLSDIFVIVALLSISVGLVLPGMITHSAIEVSEAAKRLTHGTVRDFSNAMAAFGRGDLDVQRPVVNTHPVSVHSRDELGAMARSFNELLIAIQNAAINLKQAQEKMKAAKAELVSEHRKISHLAHHDALTDLPNRTILSLHINAALASRPPNGQVALFILDLDNFKAVNDTLGHAAGDELLILVSNRLKSIIGTAGTVARLGGDEFAILSTGDDLASRSKNLAAHVIEAMAEPWPLTGKEVTCSASIGIAMSPSDALQSADLLRYADMALYAAKEEKSAFRFFAKRMEDRLQERSALMRDLQLAIDTDGLKLQYQPVVSLDANTTTYVEALVRWTHPTRGPISPSVFVPLAEESGLISDIGQFVLPRACQDASNWPEDIGVAVNISALELADAGLVDRIKSALQFANLAPARLQIEVTETAFMRDVQRSVSTLRAITDLGVEIAMDDFGIGYSSLSSLRSFPFARLKIDRAFVRDLETSSQAQSIFAAIVELADALGMQTTAEGVETIEQLDLVRSFGCSHVQGYVFYHPMDARTLSEIIIAPKQVVAA